MIQNLLSKITEFAKEIPENIRNLYSSEWILLVIIIGAIITILVPLIALIRYWVRLRGKFPEVPIFKFLVLRDFSRLTIEDSKGQTVRHFQEIEVVPKRPGISSFEWILGSDGFLQDFIVYPGEIKAINKELGKWMIEQDLKRILNEGEHYTLNISYTALDAYTRASEYYFDTVYNPTKILSFEIIFPLDRLPKPESLCVSYIRGTPVYTERIKPKVGNTKDGLPNVTWLKKRVRLGYYKIVWDW